MGDPGDRPSGIPAVRLTPSLVGHVVMDESIMAMAVGPNRFPRRADYHRVGDELARAHALFTERGWLEDPASYHQTPTPLEEPAVTRGWALGRSYERLWWPSGYEPHLGVPGTDRWLAFDANRTASAWVLRHRDRSRPWIVCIHGFGTGSTFMDLVSFRAARLHDRLGVNVASIVLPVHGARRPSRISGEEFLGFELMNSVHGLTQSLWDVRRLLTWVRRQDPDGVGVFGVSLGGLITALVAGFEDDLDLALAGVPIVDFPGLIEHHAPRHLHLRSIEHNILNGTAQDVHRVVSPLALPTATPPAARAIFAGLGDRLAPPTRRDGCGSTGTNRRPAGSAATTSATCGPTRCGASWTPRSSRGASPPETRLVASGGGAPPDDRAQPMIGKRRSAASRSSAVCMVEVSSS